VETTTVWYSLDRGKWNPLIQTGHIKSLTEGNDFTFFLGTLGEIWYSGAGMTASLVLNQSDYTLISAHPVQPVLFAGKQGSCVDTHSQCLELYYSEDKGSSWLLVHPRVIDFDWNQDTNTLPLSAFLLVEDTNATTVWLHNSLQKTSITNLVTRQNVAAYDYMPGMGIYLVQKGLLMLSVDTGKTFSQVLIPETGYQIRDVFVISAKPGSLMLLALYSHPQLSTVADLFVSDAPGNVFDISISRVTIGPRNPDLFPLEGMNGAYVVSRYYADLDTEYYERVTMITYNYGVTWNYLTRPADSSCPINPLTQEAVANCNLHLHFSSTADGLDLSSPLADSFSPGGLIAYGEVGSGLLATTPSLFYSNDAGLTWKSISTSQRWNYAFVNGGILVMSSLTAFQYSLDYGNSFLTCDIFVAGALYGNLVAPSKHAFIWNQNNFADLDFSSEFSRDCTSADYEYFSAENRDGSPACVLGSLLSLERRTPTSQCFLPDDYIEAQTTSPCACTAADFRCASCYVKEYWNTNGRENRNCVWSCPDQVNPHPLPATCNTGAPSYPINGSSPYVKWSYSLCTEGVNYEDSRQVLASCNNLNTSFTGHTRSPEPDSSDSTDAGLAVLIVILIVAGFILLVGLVWWYHSSKQAPTPIDTLPPVTTTATTNEPDEPVDLSQGVELERDIM